jgi:PAS domain S-box-containing protein
MDDVSKTRAGEAIGLTGHDGVHPDQRVLGQLLAMPTSLASLPFSHPVAKFIAQTIISVPGVSSCRACLLDASGSAGLFDEEACGSCPLSRKDLTEAPCLVDKLYCTRAERGETRSIKLETFDRKIGILALVVSEPNVFAAYEPFLENIGKIVSLALESRLQRELLEEKFHDMVERCKQLVNHESGRTIGDGESFHGFQGIFGDITAIRQLENALLESEGKYQTIFKNSGNALIFAEDDMTISMCNREFEKLSGYSRAEVEGCRKWTEFVKDENDLERLKASHRLRLLNPEAAPQTCEFQAVDREGNVKDIAATVAVLPGTKKSLAALVDITDRKRAEKALRESEWKFRAIFEHTFQFIGLMTLDGTLIEANRTALRFTGVEESEVIGKPFWETPWWRHSTELQAELRAAIAKAAQGEFVRFEASHPSISGKLHYIDFSLKPVMDESGKVVLLIPEGRDITERKIAEEALKRSEEKYRELVENANSIILRMDNLGIVTFINEFAQHFFGYSEEEIVGKNVVGTIVPQTESLTGRDLQLMIEDIALRPDRYASNINENMRRNGERVWVAWTNKPIHYENGRVTEVLCVGNDITERKRAEEALREAYDEMERRVEERTAQLVTANDELRKYIAECECVQEALGEAHQQLNDIVEFLPDATMVLDKNKKVIAWNRAIEEMTGMKKEDILGKSDYAYSIPFYAEARPLLIDLVMGDGAEIEEKYDNMGRKGNTICGEAFVPMAYSGKGAYLWGAASPLFDVGGKMSGAILSIRDITDRKEAEKALRLSEERYRRLVESVTDYIYTVKIDEGHSVETKHGHACVAVTGYTAEEYAADADLWFRMVHPDDRKIVIEYTHLTLLGMSPPPIEHRIIHKDGSIRWVRNTSVLSFDSKGYLVGLDGMVSDITARKRAEEQLQQGKTLLQTVFDGISDPLIMMDNQLIVKMINRAARQYFNLQDDRAAIGKRCFEAFFGRTGFCKECGEYCSSVIKCHAGTYERKGRMDPARLEQVVVYPVKDEAGELNAAVVHISDITEAKLMQRQVLQSEKLASLGLLVSGIAHEINNPNSFIVFNLPILREYIEKLLPIVDDYAKDHPDLEFFCMSYQDFREDIFKLLANMEHGSHRINATVSGLKGFAKSRETRGERWVELRQVIEQGVAICRSEIRKRVKTFEVDIPESFRPIFTDPEAVEQILINLLINAVQALDKEDSWIRLRVVTEGMFPDHCVIEVSDNGCGMDENTRKKIFDPFFTTKASLGTGLGLYVCNSLIVGLGGLIEVESEVGKGSTFRIVLPNSEKRWNGGPVPRS